MLRVVTVSDQAWIAEASQQEKGHVAKRWYGVVTQQEKGHVAKRWHGVTHKRRGMLLT